MAGACFFVRHPPPIPCHAPARLPPSRSRSPSQDDVEEDGDALGTACVLAGIGLERRQRQGQGQNRARGRARGRARAETETEEESGTGTGGDRIGAISQPRFASWSSRRRGMPERASPGTSGLPASSALSLTMISGLRSRISSSASPAVNSSSLLLCVLCVPCGEFFFSSPGSRRDDASSPVLCDELFFPSSLR